MVTELVGVAELKTSSHMAKIHAHFLNETIAGSDEACESNIEANLDFLTIETR